ncbi:MAG: fumarylacetoacetate hydrolase family protein [Novosphingobium sp.]|nr:fumarylacetoacetate hydrolase family protein [Novosphingobium sp.]
MVRLIWRVTGVGSEIGRAIAERFDHEAAEVDAQDINCAGARVFRMTERRGSMARIVRYEHNGTSGWGELRDEQVFPLNGSFPEFAPGSGNTLALSEVKLLAPVVPGKIVAIGPGYKIYMQGGPEPERPHYWIKAANTVQDPEGEIVLPPGLTVNHEAEIAIVIGKRARKVAPEQAMHHVFGYTCCIDVTAGDMSDMLAYQQSQLFLDGKIFDTFAPLGPCIATDLDTSNLRIQCRVNGETRQDHRTSDKLFEYDRLVSMISHVLTLEPGDVITTGSVPGVAPMAPGDLIELEIEGIGTLRNRAVAG